ncbi:hypothetical protein [Staphylococcus sp. Marseille-Q5304]|uniref:hypothetical protein n=1 Tax=Staphylococcus sp. Marseille-Q5304 TaxID=2942200 RepID=UPI002073D594|nr:hypothetical protein [Staphylococcus sp. Marseille-Q5304]
MTSNASVVFWGEKPLIITSAHSVYEWYSKSFPERIYFFDNFGKKVKVNYIVLSRKWIDEGILDFDTAILVPEKINRYRYDKIQPKFCVSKSEKILVISQKKGLFKNKIVSYRRNIFSDDIYGSSMIGIKLKSNAGLSGSPWYYESNNKQYQMSNTSFSFKRNKKLTFAPYWDHYIEKMFEFSENFVCNHDEFVYYSLN